MIFKGDLIMYEYKQSDVFEFANFINAETYQKGNELFFKYCPRCNGDGKDKYTFSIKVSKKSGKVGRHPKNGLVMRFFRGHFCF